MEKKLDHDFCSKFRSEIKSHGLVTVVSELLASSSDKVELKKQYLVRESRKNAFADKLVAACDAVVARDRRTRIPVAALKQELGLPTM